jgi:hypothetical protein
LFVVSGGAKVLVGSGTGVGALRDCIDATLNELLLRRAFPAIAP